MAVAHDAVSESHAGTTGSASEASFSWTHTPVGTPRGVLVYTFVNANADDATGVTYGGTALTAVPGGRAVDAAAGETGDCKAWFLGSSIPTGAQTVQVTRNNNANVMYAVCVTVTADADTATAGVLLEQEDQTLTEENVDDGSPGTNSLRYMALNSGTSTLPVAAGNPGFGANTTDLGADAGIDFGSRIAVVVRETTAGQGSRPVGIEFTAADDVAAVYLAIKESAGGGGGRTTRNTRAWPLGVNVGMGTRLPV